MRVSVSVFWLGCGLLASLNCQAAELEPLSTFKDCDTCPEMIVLPPGSFSMGATREEMKDMFIGHVPAEHPAHEVSIGYQFAIGRFEVTTGEFDAYVTETGASVGGTCGIRLLEQGPLARKFTGTRHPDDGQDEMGHSTSSSPMARMPSRAWRSATSSRLFVSRGLKSPTI